MTRIRAPSSAPTPRALPRPDPRCPRRKSSFRVSLLYLGAALASCGGGGGGGSSEELPPIPSGLLRDPAEWQALPVPGRDPACTPGSACERTWDNVLAWAAKWDDPAIQPDITESIDFDNDHDVVTLACALAWRGTGDLDWRDRARILIDQAVFTPYSTIGTSALKPGRNLLAYVLAANTIELALFDPLLDGAFRAWIERIAETDLWFGDGVRAPGTFADYQEQRPNNVGLIVGASRIAIEMYLGGTAHQRHLVSAMRVFRGFLGDDTAFDFADEDFGGGFRRLDNS